jgi:hypothetical protein
VNASAVAWERDDDSLVKDGVVLTAGRERFRICLHGIDDRKRGVEKDS